MDKKFTFDDILLVPAYSDTEREEVDISSWFTHHKLSVPVLSSPMDTITGIDMAHSMNTLGGLGVHHRGNWEKDYNPLLYITSTCLAICPSMGLDFVHEIIDINPALILFLDVAHGNTERNLDFCASLVQKGAKIVSGNIVSKEAALRYLDVGINYFRVGIGSGGACTTRLVTGVGYPQASAITEINELRFNHPGMKIISDGGHRTTGDIVKALALGADFVMLGGMLAGTDEAEGITEIDGKKFGAYRGMASAQALSTRKKEFFVEGIGKNVEYKGSVKDVLKNIKDAIEQACYYVGARNLQELREAEIIYLSEGSMRESYVR